MFAATPAHLQCTCIAPHHVSRHWGPATYVGTYLRQSNHLWYCSKFYSFFRHFSRRLVSDLALALFMPHCINWKIILHCTQNVHLRRNRDRRSYLRQNPSNLPLSMPLRRPLRNCHRWSTRWTGYRSLPELLTYDKGHLWRGTCIQPFSGLWRPRAVIWEWKYWWVST